MRLACQEQLLPGASLVQRWDAGRALGFDAIELRGAGGFGLRARLPELRAARRQGLVVSGVCPDVTHFIGDFDPGRRRDAADNLRSQLSVVAELGGLGVITPAAWGLWSNRLPPFRDPPRTPGQDREVLAEALAELGAHATQEGVTLWLEPLNRYEDHMVNTVAQATALVAAAGGRGLGVMLDTYHANIEERDLAQTIRSAALGHVHLSDSNRLPPGSGHVDFAAVLRALHDSGYDGYLAFECRLDGDPADVLRRAVRFVRAVSP